MNAIGHSEITKAAIASLSKEEQKWLRDEKDFLIEIYCHFPDMNWPWFGELGGETGNPNEARMPDERREWNISYYCGWDPLRESGDIFPPGRNILPPSNPNPSIYPNHDFATSRFCPMGAYWAPGVYLPKIIQALEEGSFEDGIRFLGALLHHIEDRGAFAYWPDLHKIGNLKDLSSMQIKSYKPRVLGKNVAEAAAGVEKRMREIMDFDTPRVPLIREAYKKNDKETVESIILEFWQEAARAVADTIHTVITLSDCGHYCNYWGYWIEFPHAGNPTMLNLVDNPSFENDDGAGFPDGWFVKWKDLDDKLGRAEWDKSSMHSVFSKNIRSGSRSLKIMLSPPEGIEWLQRRPSAIKVVPGEKYSFSGWMKTLDATGKSYFTVYFHDKLRTLGAVSSDSFSGTSDWTRVSFEFSVPQSADRMRLACSSCGNSGAVWFDDVEIIRLENKEST